MDPGLNSTATGWTRVQRSASVKCVNLTLNNVFVLFFVFVFVFFVAVISWGTSLMKPVLNVWETRAVLVPSAFRIK